MSSRPMKRKKNLQRMIIWFIYLCLIFAWKHAYHRQFSHLSFDSWASLLRETSGNFALSICSITVFGHNYPEMKVLTHSQVLSSHVCVQDVFLFSTLSVTKSCLAWSAWQTRSGEFWADSDQKMAQSTLKGVFWQNFWGQWIK